MDSDFDEYSRDTHYRVECGKADFSQQVSEVRQPTPSNNKWKDVHLFVHLTPEDRPHSHSRWKGTKDLLIDFIGQARNYKVAGSSSSSSISNNSSRSKKSKSSKSNQSHQRQCPYTITTVEVRLQFCDLVAPSVLALERFGKALKALEGLEKVVFKVVNDFIPFCEVFPSFASSITHLCIDGKAFNVPPLLREQLFRAMLGFSKLQKLRLFDMDIDLVNNLLCSLAPKTLIIKNVISGVPEHLFNHALEFLQVPSEAVTCSADKAIAFTQALLSRHCNLKGLAIDQSNQTSFEDKDVIEIFRQCFQHQSTIQEVHICNGRHSLLPSALIHTRTHDASDATDTPAPIERRLTYSGDLSCLNFPSLATSSIRLESLSIEDFQDLNSPDLPKQTRISFCNWLASSSCPLKHLKINLNFREWATMPLVAIKSNSSLYKTMESLKLHGTCASSLLRDEYAIPAIKILEDLVPKMKQLHTLCVYPPSPAADPRRPLADGPRDSAVPKPGILVEKFLESLTKNKTLQQVSVMPVLVTNKQQDEIQSICQHNQLSQIIRTMLQDSSQPLPSKEMLAKLVGGKEKNSTAFISLCFLSLSEYGGGLSDDRAKSLCMFLFTLKEQDYDTWVALVGKLDAGVQSKHRSDYQMYLLEENRIMHKQLLKNVAEAEADLEIAERAAEEMLEATQVELDEIRKGFAESNEEHKKRLELVMTRQKQSTIQQQTMLEECKRLEATGERKKCDELMKKLLMMANHNMVLKECCKQLDEHRALVDQEADKIKERERIRYQLMNARIRNAQNKARLKEFLEQNSHLLALD